MAALTSRITSKDVYIEFLPLSLTVETHIQHLYFDAAVNGGTFKLWVNGETTAAITMTGTALTDVASINTALDALPNLAAGDIVASGAAITDITLTATGKGDYFFVILIKEEALTQTVPNSNEKVVTEVTTQGSDWVRLSADASAVDWSNEVETVDVTAISEYDRVEIPVAEAVSGTLSLYKVKADATVIQSQLACKSSNWGWLKIYPEGKIIGKEVISFRALIDGFSEDYPDHEKVEQEISFMRQGAWINEPSSIYRG